MYKETTENGRVENRLSGLDRYPLVEISERPGNAGKIKIIERGHLAALILNYLSHRTV